MAVPSRELTLPVELKRRLHPFPASENKKLTLLLVLPLVVMALATIALAGLNPDKSKAALEQVSQGLANWLILSVVALALLFLWLVYRYERIVISSQGIEYRSFFAGPFGFLEPLKPSWKLSWNEVSSVSIVRGPKIPKRSARRRILMLWSGRGTKRALEFYQWYEVPDLAGIPQKEWQRLSDARFLQAVEQTPLYRICLERRILDPHADQGEVAKPFSDLPGGSFDLSRDPGAKASLIILAILGAYGVIDGVFASPWRNLEAPPEDPFIWAGLMAGLVGIFLGRKAPALERIALAVLLTAAAVGATYPGLQRYNAATDPDGARSYLYRQTGVGQFEPVNAENLPPLRFTQGMEYWRDLASDREKVFRLTKGHGGFWMLDLSDVRAAQRTFYRAHPELK